MRATSGVARVVVKMPIPVITPAEVAVVMVVVMPMMVAPPVVVPVMMMVTVVMTMAPSLRRIGRHDHEGSRHHNARRYDFTPHASILVELESCVVCLCVLR